MSTHHVSRRSILLVLAMLATRIAPAAAQSQLPAYEIISIGSQIVGVTAGSAMSVNENGDVAGYVAFESAWDHTPFVFTADLGPILLPRPGYAVTARALAISDRLADGTVDVVGYAAPSIYSGDQAIAWRVSTVTGEVLDLVELGTLDGLVQSQALAVNNHGDRVGYSGGFMQYGGPATLFSADGPQQIGSLSSAVAVNESRVVLAGVGWESARFDLNSGTQENLGRPPGRFNGAFGKAMNDLGHVAAQVPTGNTDPRGQYTKQVWRFTDGVGWEYVFGGASSVDFPSGINNRGDVIGKIVVALSHIDVLYLEGPDAAFQIEDLLAEGFRGVQVDGLNDINDAQQIATAGPGGPVLLSPVAALPAPTAPANLVATPHEPTPQQSFVSIDLAWDDTSSFTEEFAVERRISGAAGFVEIARRTPTDYRDLAVDLGVTYDYRVKAIGVAGDSPYSDIATATAPEFAADREPPLVTLLRPQDGATVSGSVTVEVAASDRSGIWFIELSATGPGGSIAICTRSVDGASPVQKSCKWNTRKLAEGAYTIVASAYDTWGNRGTVSIDVTVGGKGRPRLATHDQGETGVTVLGVETIAVRGTIRLALDRPGHTRLTLFDVAGRRVATLVDQHMDRGIHEIDWDSRDTHQRTIPNGVYFYQLQSGNRAKSGRIVVAR